VWSWGSSPAAGAAACAERPKVPRKTDFLNERRGFEDRFPLACLDDQLRGDAFGGSRVAGADRAVQFGHTSAILSGVTEGDRTDSRLWDRLALVGGLAAVLSGAAWVAKSTAILIFGDQPPLLFEIGPLFFGLGLLGVASSTMTRGRRRAAVVGLATASAAAGLLALLLDRPDAINPALVASTLTLLAGLWTVPRNAAWPAPLTWWIGIALIPALLAGGVLSLVQEDLVEVPLLCIGVAWMTVGGALLRRHAALRSGTT
jgi:hypothetical protein